MTPARPAPPHSALGDAVHCVRYMWCIVRVIRLQKRGMELLEDVDHSALEYEDFAKDFYSENPAIAAMGEAEVGASVVAVVAVSQKQQSQ